MPEPAASAVASMPAATTATTTPRRLSAEEGVWVFIGGDMAMFALFFNVYAYYRALTPELFNASQATLDARIGLVNMLLLLTGSWFIVQALRAVRLHERETARRWIAAGLACGAGFCVLKVLEYTLKIRAGITLVTNDFYMYYFMFTGVHFVHLLLGMAVLLYLFAKARRTDWADKELRLFEGGFAYWHMVDLLWIVLFPLIYLVR